MSRIEKALEKAIALRESSNDFAKKEALDSTTDTSQPVYVAAEGCIDCAGVDKHLISITDPYSAAGEQYKKLRARLLRSTRKDAKNTIMITSSDVGEGKTVTAINLAATLSQEIDHTVLLVDADLRKPSIHSYLGIRPERGLSDYLRGEVDLRDVLIKTGIGKLTVLPGGSPTDEAPELLSSERMKSLVNELKFRYKDRYIIFDSSPMLVTSDPLSLGGYMDGVLFVIQEGRTSQKAALQSTALMKGWNVLGVVFNNVPEYLTRRVYPYYYRYGKGSDTEKSNGDRKKL